MENAMNKLITLAALVMAVAASGNVLAHGDKPKHGGVVQAASDLAFELVNQDGKATIYVEDHGKPVSTAGVTGKLTVLNGAEKSELPLEPAGDNTLATKGEAKLAKGAKAIAALTFADKKAVNVRFSMK
jgi:uncharacterized Zn-binding protein involved in type VI secretion